VKVVEGDAAKHSTGAALDLVVLDARCQPLADATVLAASVVTGTNMADLTDAQGRTHLDLPPGEYELTAELPSFAKFIRRGIVVRAGLNLAVDIDLVLGGRTETTMVTAETPMLESSSAVQAVNISGEFQRDVPLTNRRDWADSLPLVPGVVTTQNGTGKVFYYVHGADQSSLVLQVDGADLASTLQNTNSYINLSDHAIQDTQIKTGGVDASAPIGAGAIVSVVTQSGTNQLKGAVGIVYQGEDWNGNNAPGGTSSEFEIVQPDASLGGPLLKDRAWLFGAYRHTNNSLGVSRTAPALPPMSRMRYFPPQFGPTAISGLSSRCQKASRRCDGVSCVVALAKK